MLSVRVFVVFVVAVVVALSLLLSMLLSLSLWLFLCEVVLSFFSENMFCSLCSQDYKPDRYSLLRAHAWIGCVCQQGYNPALLSPFFCYCYLIDSHDADVYFGSSVSVLQRAGDRARFRPPGSYGPRPDVTKRGVRERQHCRVVCLRTAW